MRRYRYKLKVYVFSVLGIVLNCVLLWLIDDFLVDIILAISIVAAILNFLNLCVSRYELTNNKLIMKSCYTKTEIDLDSIICIASQSAGKFVGESIAIVDGTRKISITALTNEYWDLIARIVESAINNERIRVDSYVLNRIALDKS
jgi:hypothetical protein